MIQPEKEEKTQAPPSRSGPEHIPTGTFRKNSEDGCDDLNFGSNAGGTGFGKGMSGGGSGSRFAAKKKD